MLSAKDLLNSSEVLNTRFLTSSKYPCRDRFRYGPLTDPVLFRVGSLPFLDHSFECGGFRVLLLDHRDREFFHFYFSSFMFSVGINYLSRGHSIQALACCYRGRARVHFCICDSSISISDLAGLVYGGGRKAHAASAANSKGRIGELG